MDCIPYINDLVTEIKILKDVKANGNCDVDTINQKIEEKESLVNECKNNLSKLSNNQICYRIYLNMLNGLNPTQAIEKVAHENYINGVKPTDIPTIWKNYYKKMKKILKTQ